MVEITNGIDVIEVTDGAYNSVFKSQGYRLVKAENKVLEKTSEDQKEESKVVDLEQKPVSQWSKQEIALFAEVNGIDLSGTKNVNEAKKVIKEFMAKAEEDAAAEDDDDWDE